MHAHISTTFSEPIIKPYGTESITLKLTHITISPKLTGTFDMISQKIHDVLFSTIMRLFLRVNYNHDCLAELFDITFGMDLEYKRPRIDFE